MLDTATAPKNATFEDPAIAVAPWSCCAQPPGALAQPYQFDDAEPRWIPAIVPGTVAAALRANGQWDLGQLLDADAFDWWYRSSFAATDVPPDRPCFLCFDGLATLAEIWLNGERLLTTDNMFRAYRLDITLHLKSHNELAIVFRSLTADLAKKRPRPRWK